LVQARFEPQTSYPLQKDYATMTFTEKIIEIC